MAAYVLAQIEVTNPEGYKDYTAVTPGLIAKHGGRFLVRGGPAESLEGPEPGRRIVIIEFPDSETVRRFYNSPEYQEAVKIRQANSEGSLWLLEGVD